MKGIDTFSKEEFESALPGKWTCLGIVDFEYCYLIPVTDTAGVMVRSSIHRNQVNAGLAQDSIRCYPTTIRYIQTISGHVWSYQFNGDSPVRWIDRRPGWEKRLQEMIEKSIGMIETAGTCSVCGKPRVIRKVQKEGPNKGRFFAGCTRACDAKKKQFVWLD